jgi:hypothetical protein
MKKKEPTKMKNKSHKPVTMEDIENLLSPDEMKQFAAGAKFAFGPPASPRKKIKSVSAPNK